MKRGALIVIEGVDRTGKSTQAKNLVESLKKQQIAAEYTNFPNRNTEIGKVINAYLTSKNDLSDEAIHLLFSANRWECANYIIKQLESGTTVVVDRYCFSGVAFSASKGDWTILMDMYEKHYRIPEDVGISSSRPDIFLFSKELRRIVLVELTVPWETIIPKDYAMKTNKYYDLVNDLTRNVFTVSLYAVEVGERGLDINWCKSPDIGLPKPDKVFFLTMPFEYILQRNGFGKERYEVFEFQKKVSEIYMKLKDESWEELDANRSIEEVHKELLAKTLNIIESSTEKPLNKIWLDVDKKL